MRAVLFTCHEYSKTTSRHKWMVQRVLGGETVFYVSEVYDAYAPQNIEYHDDLISTAAHDLVRRTNFPNHTARLNLERRVRDANDFCKFFGIRKTFAMPKEDQVAAWRKKYMAERAEKAAETRRLNIIEAKCKPIEDYVATICQAEDNLLRIARERREPETEELLAS